MKSAIMSKKGRDMHSVLVQVSVGELLDKLTILELKALRIPGEEQQKNIHAELVLLQQSFVELAPRGAGLDVLIERLRQVNSELWNIEDDIRTCERERRFDEEFIALARSVYRKNDERAALKASINELCGSTLREEKYYTQYALQEPAA